MMIRNALRALGAAMLLASPLPLPAQNAKGDQLEAPEVLKLSLRGVKAFAGSDIQQSIATEASHCRGLILTPICWITKSKAVYAHFFLDRKELARDVLRIRVFYWKRGYRETTVDTVVTPIVG